MHDHATCEQLMAAANRTGHYGRLEYLTARCDATHGRAAAAQATTTSPETTQPEEGDA